MNKKLFFFLQVSLLYLFTFFAVGASVSFGQTVDESFYKANEASLSIRPDGLWSPGDLEDEEIP